MARSAPIETTAHDYQCVEMKDRLDWAMQLRSILMAEWVCGHTTAKKPWVEFTVLGRKMWVENITFTDRNWTTQHTTAYGPDWKMTMILHVSLATGDIDGSTVLVSNLPALERDYALIMMAY